MKRLLRLGWYFDLNLIFSFVFWKGETFGHWSSKCHYLYVVLYIELTYLYIEFSNYVHEKRSDVKLCVRVCVCVIIQNSKQLFTLKFWPATSGTLKLLNHEALCSSGQAFEQSEQASLLLNLKWSVSIKNLSFLGAVAFKGNTLDWYWLILEVSIFVSKKKKTYIAPSLLVPPAILVSLNWFDQFLTGVIIWKFH